MEVSSASTPTEVWKSNLEALAVVNKMELYESYQKLPSIKDDIISGRGNGPPPNSSTPDSPTLPPPSEPPNSNPLDGGMLGYLSHVISATLESDIQEKETEMLEEAYQNEQASRQTQSNVSEVNKLSEVILKMTSGDKKPKKYKKELKKTLRELGIKVPNRRELRRLIKEMDKSGLSAGAISAIINRMAASEKDGAKAKIETDDINRMFDTLQEIKQRIKELPEDQQEGATQMTMTILFAVAELLSYETSDKKFSLGGYDTADVFPEIMESLIEKGFQGLESNPALFSSPEATEAFFQDVMLETLFQFAEENEGYMNNIIGSSTYYFNNAIGLQNSERQLIEEANTYAEGHKFSYEAHELLRQIEELQQFNEDPTSVDLSKKEIEENLMEAMESLGLEVDSKKKFLKQLDAFKEEGLSPEAILLGILSLSPEEGHFTEVEADTLSKDDAPFEKLIAGASS